MDCWQEIGQRQGMGLIPVLAAHLYDRDVEVDVLREDFLALAQEAGRESAALEQVCAQVQDRLELGWSNTCGICTTRHGCRRWV